MAIQITRRDLLNGMAVGAVGAMFPAYPVRVLIHQ